MDDFEKKQLQNLVGIQVLELVRLRKKIIRLETSVVYRAVTTVGDLLFSLVSVLWGKHGKDKNRQHGINKTVPYNAGSQWSFNVYKEQTRVKKYGKKQMVWRSWCSKLLSFLRWGKGGPFVGSFEVWETDARAKKVPAKSRNSRTHV